MSGKDKLKISIFDLEGDYTAKQAARLYSKKVKKTALGYAGYKTKADFQSMHYSLADDASEYRYDRLTPAQKQRIISIVTSTIRKCMKHMRSPQIMHVYVFVSRSRFTAEKMRGSSGYCPYKNTIHIYLHPTRGWERAVASTMAHEYTHAVLFNYQSVKTLHDSIIFEGIADNFGESIVKHYFSPWTAALTRTALLKVVPGIIKIAKSTSTTIYRAVFFGSKRYTPWTGYSLGYQVVKQYRKKHGSDWDAMIAQPLREIPIVLK